MSASPSPARRRQFFSQQESHPGCPRSAVLPAKGSPLWRPASGAAPGQRACTRARLPAAPGAGSRQSPRGCAQPAQVLGQQQRRKQNGSQAKNDGHHFIYGLLFEQSLAGQGEGGIRAARANREQQPQWIDLDLFANQRQQRAPGYRQQRSQPPLPPGVFPAQQVTQGCPPGPASCRCRRSCLPRRLCALPRRRTIPGRRPCRLPPEVPARQCHPGLRPGAQESSAAPGK